MKQMPYSVFLSALAVFEHTTLFSIVLKTPTSWARDMSVLSDAEVAKSAGSGLEYVL